MSAEIKEVLSFPRDSPPATAGVFFQDKGLLFTGHDNGLVIEWQLPDGKHRVLYDCNSRVESISASSSDELVVGCISGLLLTIPTDTGRRASIIQEATNTVYSRVWRVLRPQDDIILTSSTYGTLNLYQRNGSWESVRLPGHGNSVFGLASLNGQFISSGDYRGNIVIREGKSGRFQVLDSASAASSVEALAWRDDGALAAIDHSGHISFFERDPTTQKWRSVFETDTASSRGRAIHFTRDGNTVFAGTDTEIIQFDLDSQQVQLIRSPPTRAIFSNGNTIYVLGSNGLFSFERSPVIVPEALLKYKYAKVSLIGRTSVGKSRLCRTIAGVPIDKLQSTFGRETLDWILPNGIPERRIIFHDHGGQDSVLETFLPFLADSDVIVVIYKQTDRMSYEKARRLLDEVESIAARRPVIFFVQTHTDMGLNEVKYDEPDIQKLVKSGRITQKFELSTWTGSGLPEFKQGLAKSIHWEDARTMLQSQYTDGLLKTLSELESQRVGIVNVDEIKSHFEQNVGLPISIKHLEFLLTNFSNQGRVEYYPVAMRNAVIMNDDRYNKLRTEIPIFAQYKHGIVSMGELGTLETQYGRPGYLKVLDEVYKSYGVSVQFRDIRIFPEMLKDRLEIKDLPEPYRRFVESPLLEDEKQFRHERIDNSTLLRALSELSLGCVEVSGTEGVFAWETNACIYYQILEPKNAGETTRIHFSVGGEKEPIVRRLAGDFSSIIERLFGPSEPGPPVKKKADTVEYDVAVSYASEQEDYVSKVVVALQNKGVEVFYAPFLRSRIWGKELAVYLQQIFYSKSRWCMVFISKEFIDKVYTIHELNSALAKQVEQKGEYILPVRWDKNVEVPGLNPTIAYQNAKKLSPEELADLFIEKLESKSA